jgi:hypothetical protein
MAVPFPLSTTPSESARVPVAPWGKPIIIKGASGLASGTESSDSAADRVAFIGLVTGAGFDCRTLGLGDVAPGLGRRKLDGRLVALGTL